jgi:hypothetical protein
MKDQRKRLVGIYNAYRTQLLRIATRNPSLPGLSAIADTNRQPNQRFLSALERGDIWAAEDEIRTMRVTLARVRCQLRSAMH